MNEITQKSLKKCRNDYSLRRRGSDGRVVTNEELMRRKSTFDRFGDDLSEVIHSYLPLKDKFRFECLNKTIQNLIYNSQRVLRIHVNQDDIHTDIITYVNGQIRA